MPRSDVVGSYDISFPKFLKSLIFPVAALVYALNNSVPGSPVTSNCILDDSYSDWGEMESQSDFNQHYPGS